jgi:hypothetical protein
VSLLSQLLAKRREWEGWVVVDQAKNELQTVLVYLGGRSNVLFCFEAASIAISLEQVSHEAQTDIEPARDLSLRAFAI